MNVLIFRQFHRKDSIKPKPAPSPRIEAGREELYFINRISDCFRVSSERNPLRVNLLLTSRSVHWHRDLKDEIVLHAYLVDAANECSLLASTSASWERRLSFIS